MLNSVDSFRGYGGPVRPYERMYDSLDYDDVSIDYIIIIDIKLSKTGENLRESEIGYYCNLQIYLQCKLMIL